MIHVIKTYIPICDFDLEDVCRRLGISVKSKNGYLRYRKNRDSNSGKAFMRRIKEINTVLSNSMVISKFFFGTFYSQDDQFFIDLTVDIKALVDGYKSINLYSSEHDGFDLFRKRFHEFITTQLNLPEKYADITTYIFRYIEFAENFTVKKEFSKAYMTMLKKTAIPAKGYIYDHNENTVYLRSKANYNYGRPKQSSGQFFKIYNKTKAIREAQPYVNYLENPFHDVYRAELSINRPKIRQLLNENNLTVAELLSDDFTHIILKKCVQDFFLPGDFTKSNSVDKLIKHHIKQKAAPNKRSGKAVEKKITKYIDLRKKLTLHKAVSNTSLTSTEKKMLKTFEEINVCPIPLPREYAATLLPDNKNKADYHCIPNYLYCSFR